MARSAASELDAAAAGAAVRCMVCERPVIPAAVAIEHGWPTICGECAAVEEQDRKGGRR